MRRWFVPGLPIVMSVSAGGVFCFGAAGVASDVSPPGEYIGLGSADHAGGSTFEWGEPVVGTTYFYWYDIDSKAHIIDGDDATWALPLCESVQPG